MKSIALDGNTYGRFACYANAVGKPVDHVITKALNRWMDESGEIILKSFQKLSAQQAKSKNTPSKRERKKLAPVIAFTPVAVPLPQVVS